ncbi:hypothetical protein BS47DRAFT_1361758 [Hydnum rufescens UP504]|uniref:Uncharacterized protein n=1 Tax=Hydnum rufescens UP504 TaxID=1448309 RepID=A0A9P6AYJ2_9AGAM|nr:hypothetical protein BS47DRAFT_1361758 [Hydnum rufescens UP504]
MARNAEMIKKKALHLHMFSNIALVAFLINEDLGDGHATSQNSLDLFKTDILNSLFDVVRTAGCMPSIFSRLFNWMLRYHQSSKANRPSGTDEMACEIEDKKHEVSTNRDTANAALASFMKPILEPHGIGTKKTKMGLSWAFPGKHLGLRLCTKKIMLVGWPDELPVLLPDGSKYSRDDLLPFINNCAFNPACHIQVQKWETSGQNSDFTDYPLIKNRNGDDILSCM